MKAIKITLAVFGFWMMAFFVSEPAFARSQSLTTTIVITVKAEPKGNLLPDDQNAELPNPYLKKESTQDLKASGEEIYTITDRL